MRLAKAEKQVKCCLNFLHKETHVVKKMNASRFNVCCNPQACDIETWRGKSSQLFLFGSLLRLGCFVSASACALDVLFEKPQPCS